MEQEPVTIAVGLATAGKPVLRQSGPYTLVKNLRIGTSFHWERPVQSVLPGDVTETGRSDFQLVNRVPLEEYLRCVVGSEMNPEAPLEFLKAHAVISRSWALGKILRSHPEGAGARPEGINENGTLRIVGWNDTGDHDFATCGFHVCGDDHCQRYQGVQPLSQAPARAIEGTRGLVLADCNGNLVDARFSKCCGGRTELFSTCWQDVDMPSLGSFEDPWCDLTSLAPGQRDRVLHSVLKDYDRPTPFWRWTERVPPALVEKNLRERFGTDIGKVTDLKPLKRGPSGRISLLAVEGTRGKVEIGKELWIRRLLSPTHLYSSAFTVSREGEDFLLHGKGWGHGVGLCQIGAANMALHGHTFRSILEFYYPGASLVAASELGQPRH